MERILLTISDNGLEAIVRIEPGPAAGPEALSQSLAEAGVVHGVDAVLIRDLAPRLADPEFAYAGVLARGAAAEPGNGGMLEFAFSLDVAPGRQAVDGSVDWRERSFLHGFTQGDEVARYHPPTPGIAGRTVRGEPVAPRPGADTLPDLGDGVKLEVDGRLVATRDGVLRYTPGRLLDVVPLYVHDGDVDLQTGNLHARGSVQVCGDVQEDMVVEASADVEVRGSVLGGEVRAAGTAVVRQGVQGEGSAVRAGRDLTCRHATTAELTAGGSLRVLDHLMHCRLAAETISVDRGRGTAVGGELRARRSIIVREAGSENGAPTLLSAGDLTSEFAELLRLQQEDLRLRRRSAKLALTGAGDKDRRLTRAATLTGDRIQQRRKELERLGTKLLRDAEILVRGTAHAGVRVRFGPLELEIQDAVRGARFTYSTDEHAIRMETRDHGVERASSR